MPDLQVNALTPLTPFEQLMLLDDRRRYRMTCYFDLVFAGDVDMASLRTALDRAVRRHFRFCSRVATSHGKAVWKPEETFAIPIQCWDARCWDAVDQYPADLAAGFDLRREPGLRLCVARGAGGSRLLMQFHHACSDGVGAISFLGDLLSGYQDACGGRAAAIPDQAGRDAGGDGAGSNPAAVAEREGLQMGSLPLSEIWSHARRYFAFRPARIAGGGLRRTRQSASKPPLMALWLNEETTQALRHAAAAAQASLNDLLLRDWFLTLDDWNRRQPRAARRLRILMPVNMRSSVREETPARNMMSYGFLDRHPADFDSPQSLLAGIADETRCIRRDGLGRLFLGALDYVVKCPAALPLLLRAPICFATSVLSNVGNPARQLSRLLPTEEGALRAGNLRLLSIVCCPPVRPGTRLAMAFTAYRGRLGVMASYCGRSLGHAAAHELMESFLARLRETAESEEKADRSARVAEAQNARARFSTFSQGNQQ